MLPRPLPTVPQPAAARGRPASGRLACRTWLAALCFAGPVAAAPPAKPVLNEATAALLAPCVECHGDDGIARTPATPHMNGQLLSYLVESIDALAAGRRPTVVPKHVPPGLGPDQVALIAAQYANAVATREPVATDPDKAAAGRGVYLERCSSCHAEEGRESDEKGMGSPLLAGQKLTYLIAQTRAFAKGQRHFSANAMKRAFVGEPLVIAGALVRRGHEGLSEADIEAVSHFYASVQAPSKTRRRRPPPR